MDTFNLTSKISDKQFITSEIIFRLINYYRKDNISQFTSKQISSFGIGHNEIKKYIKLLDLNHKIKNLTTNGYCYKIQILDPSPCYNFLLNTDLTKTQKFFLLVLFEYNKLYPIQIYSLTNLSRIIYGNDNNLQGIRNNITRISLLGTGTYQDILNNQELTKEVINNDIYTNPDYEETEYGFKSIKKKINTNNTYKCQYCGEEDPSKFSLGSHITCKKCTNKKRREREMSNLSKWLFSKVIISCKRKILECDITEKYLEEILNEQDHVCYYTNKPFGNDEFNSPSVDRIDSSKGYIKGNVVICRAGINIMKNDLDLESFKKEVCNIYENLDNIK